MERRPLACYGVADVSASGLFADVGQDAAVYIQDVAVDGVGGV